MSVTELPAFDITQLSILLVEPSATQHKIIQRQLTQIGVTQLDSVSDAQSALSYIMQYPPDLVISAMYLPDMTAADLRDHIRTLPNAQQCLFLLISSETEQTALEPIRQAGVVAILPKPFSVEDLQIALQATVDYIDPHELVLQHYDATQLKILVVDDSLVSRNHLQRVMLGMGIGYVAVAQNGVEAIETLQQEDFDLIVTDLNMPEMDGRQLVEHIRIQLGNHYIPILVITSEQDRARLADIQQAHVSAVLDKPFNPEAVRNILQRVLESND